MKLKTALLCVAILSVAISMTATAPLVPAVLESLPAVASSLRLQGFVSLDIPPRLQAESLLSTLPFRGPPGIPVHA